MLFRSAVQAATGATRENSLHALLRLQDQLSSNTEACENSLFNSRLSRVVTKLANRVIKAIESTPHPFSSSSMDMETIFCVLEDTMEIRNKSEARSEGSDATENLAKLIVSAILKSRGEATSMRKEIHALDIDPYSSALGGLISSCSTHTE